VTARQQSLEAWRESTDALFEWWRAVGVVPAPDDQGLAPDFRASVLFEALAHPDAVPSLRETVRRMWFQVEAWFAHVPHCEWLRDETTAEPLAKELPGWLAADVVECLAALAAISYRPVDLRPWLRAMPHSSDERAWRRERDLLRAQVAPSWPVMSRTIDTPPSPVVTELPVPPLVLDQAHLAVLRHGLDRRDMDEKWMWQLEGETLRLWRSWTGRLVFEAHLGPHGVNARHVDRLRIYGQTHWSPRQAAIVFCTVVLFGVRFAAAGAPRYVPQIVKPCKKSNPDEPRPT
jgi:hypothetical protein